jgi:hypothetical protein
LDIPQEVFYKGTYHPVTAIAPNAFAYCTALASLTLPASVTAVATSAFAYCSALASISLQSTTPSELGANAFTGIPATAAFTCPPAALDAYRNHPQWNTYFPISYPFTLTLDTDGNASVTAPVGPKAELTQLNIPQEVFYKGAYHPVTAIAPNAFANCTALSSISLPTSVTIVASSAFANCTALSSVTFPASVTVVASSAFAGCTILTSITLQSTTPPELGANAFTGIPATAAFTCPTASLDAYRRHPQWSAFFPISYTVTFIVSSTTGNATITGPANPRAEVTELDIPEKVLYQGTYYPVTTIAINAFANCPALASITLQSTTPPELGTNAFSGIPATAVFTCPSASLDAYRNHPQWSVFFSISYPISYPFTFTINASGKATITAPVGPKAELVEMDIPEKVLYQGTYYPVTAIGSGAFYNCTALRSITLPATLISVEAAAFSNCIDLATINFPNTLIFIGTSAFASSGLQSVSLPPGLSALAPSTFAHCTGLKVVRLPDIPPLFANGAVAKAEGDPFAGVSDDVFTAATDNILDSYRNHPTWAPYFPQLPPDAVGAILPSNDHHVEIFDFSGKKLFVGDERLFHNTRPDTPIIIRQPSGKAIVKVAR